MELDDHFVWIVRDAIEQLWNRSIVTRMICTTGAWASSNSDAISYCIDHELFADKNPEMARMLHRAFDIHGRKAVIAHLDRMINLQKISEASRRTH